MISRLDRGKARLALRIKGALNLFLRLTSGLLFQRARPPRNPARIVVHLIGNVGDIVVAIPALMALRERYPDSRLTLFTSAGERAKNLVGAKELLSGAWFLDGMEVYATEEIRSRRGALALLKRLRKLEPELFVSLPPNNIRLRSLVRNLIFARLTGARFAVGFEVVTLFLFAYEQAEYQRIYPTEIERNVGHLKALGINSAEAKFGFGPLSEAESQQVDRISAQNGQFVAVCPGGKQSGHRWPLERFVEVAKSLKHETGLNLIAIGNEQERHLCEQLLAGAGGGVNLAGKLTLRGTTELLSRALFLLTNDTGPMHLAAARGTPVVAIYGSKDLAGRWYPAGAGHELFRAGLACRKCLFAEAECDHCVRQIEVPDVLAGCQRVLQRLSYTDDSLPASVAIERELVGRA
jgi:ADP-heptose:LPS heptosyltransferase